MHCKTQDELRVALARIIGFERMNNALANAIDEMDTSFQASTGESPSEYIAELPA